MKRIAPIILIFLLFTGGGYYLYITKGKTDGLLRLSGLVEITELKLSFRQEGYVKTLHVHVNDRVAQGEVIAMLDAAHLQARYDEVSFRLKKAKKLLENLQTTPRAEERKEAEALLKAEKAALDHAAQNYKRYRPLFENDSISREEFEKIELAFKNANARHAAAKARLALVESGTKQEQLDAQKMEIRAIEASLYELSVSLEEATLRAPKSGVILSKNYEAGEYVRPGAVIATLGIYEECWVKVYVPADKIGDLEPGEEVRVVTDAKRSPEITGRIDEISGEASFAPRMNLREEQRGDIYYAVKVALPNADRHFKPGMPADVIFGD